MEFTNREMKLLDEISEWQEKLYQYEPTDLAALYDKWLEQGFALLPETSNNSFLTSLILGFFICMPWFRAHKFK